MTIRLPKQITPYPDRDLDCQAALEDSFRSVLRSAERAGWTPTESAAALQELAFAHLASEEANLQTDLAILQAKLGLTRH